MAIPNPPKALDGHCSTVWNDQLFVLSSDSFQSVSLKEGAKWTEEAKGQAVSGAACAKVQPGDASTAQLYVIGGKSDNAGYSGLQRYTFSSKSWETLNTPVADLRNRQNHSAIWIPRDNKILVYAGGPASESAWLSTSTFTILAAEPYTVDSHRTSGHKGGNLPILSRWDDGRAFMTGGSEIDSTTWLFDAAAGWTQYATNMPASIPSGVKGVVIQGTDGSKVLQTYDASVSPNKVTSYLLQNADGSPAQTGQTLGGSSKRDLSASSWPSYNSTDAPSITRSDFSVASDGQGLVVLAGGNADTPVSLFNQNQNSWVNAASYFNSDPSQQPLQSSSSSAASATATRASSTSAVASTTSAAATSSSPEATAGTVPATIVDDAQAKQAQQLKTQLGIILGICGAIFLFFILLLLWLRARKRKQDKGSSYVGQNEGGRMSFADRGASFMKEAEGSQQAYYPTADRYSVSQRSPYDQGGAGKHGVAGGYNNKGYQAHKQKGSYESTKELVEKDGGYMAEPVEMTPVHGKMSPIVRKPAPTYNVERAAEISAARGMTNAFEDEKDRRKRSSGWSRYFATSQPAENGLAHMPSAYHKDGVDPSPHAKDPAYTSIDSQAPSIPAMPSQLPSASLMPPLNIDFDTTIDGQRLSKVASSNPSYFNSQENLPKQADTGRIEDANRPSSSRSISAHSSFQSTSSDGDANRGPPDAWTPMTMATDFKGHSNNSRPTSSLYTASVYGERPRGGQDSFYPGSNKNKFKLSYAAAPSADWGSLNDENMVSLKHALANRDTMHSNVTVFPEPMANGDGYTATTRQPSQKSSKSAKSAKSEHNAGSGMAGLTRTTTNDNDKSSHHMTLFPRTVEIKQFPGAKSNEVIGLAAGKKAGTVNTDTSWVNLKS